MFARAILFFHFSLLLFAFSMKSDEFVLFPLQSMSNFVQFQCDIPGYIKKFATGWCAQFHKETIDSITAQTKIVWPVSLISAHMLEKQVALLRSSCSEYKYVAIGSLLVGIVTGLILKKQKQSEKRENILISLVKTPLTYLTAFSLVNALIAGSFVGWYRMIDHELLNAIEICTTIEKNPIAHLFLSCQGDSSSCF
jgi:hypothetical protein